MSENPSVPKPKEKHKSHNQTLTSNLGVELNAVHGLRFVGDSGVFRVLGLADSVESLGQVAELITVGHPYGHGILKALEQLVNMASEPGGLQVSVTIFAGGTGDNVVGVQTVGNLLETVANSQNGDAQFEEGGVDVGGTLLVHGVRTTGQDDTLGLPGQIGELLGAREHLRVDIDLS